MTLKRTPYTSKSADVELEKWTSVSPWLEVDLAVIQNERLEDSAQKRTVPAAVVVEEEEEEDRQGLTLGQFSVQPEPFLSL
jgi:hypothetical protein